MQRPKFGFPRLPRGQLVAAMRRPSSVSRWLEPAVRFTWLQAARLRRDGLEWSWANDALPLGAAVTTGVLGGIALGVLVSDGRIAPAVTALVLLVPLLRLVRLVVAAEQRGRVTAVATLAYALRVAAAVVIQSGSLLSGRGGFVTGDDQGYAATAWGLVQFLRGTPELPYVPPDWGGDAYLFGTWVYLESALYALFGFDVLIPEILNAALGGALVAFVFDFAHRSFNTRAGVCAALLVTFYPSLVLWSALNLKEALALFLIASVLWLLLRFHARPRWPLLVPLLMSLILLESIRRYIYVLLLILLPLAVAVTPRLSRRRAVAWTGVAGLLSGSLLVLDGSAASLNPGMLETFESVRHAMAPGARTSFQDRAPLRTQQGDTFVVIANQSAPLTSSSSPPTRTSASTVPTPTPAPTTSPAAGPVAEIEIPSAPTTPAQAASSVAPPVAAIETRYLPRNQRQLLRSTPVPAPQFESARSWLGAWVAAWSTASVVAFLLAIAVGRVQAPEARKAWRRTMARAWLIASAQAFMLAVAVAVAAEVGPKLARAAPVAVDTAQSPETLTSLASPAPPQRVVFVPPNAKVVLAMTSPSPSSADPSVVYVQAGDVVVVGTPDTTPAPATLRQAIVLGQGKPLGGTAAQGGDDAIRLVSAADGSDRIARTVAYLPKGIAHALLAPFVWAIGSWQDAVTAPEMLLWYALLVAMVRSTWSFRAKWRSLGPLLLFVLGLVTILSLAEGNYGTLYRHRAMVIPFVVVLASPQLALLAGALARTARSASGSLSSKGGAQRLLVRSPRRSL